MTDHITLPRSVVEQLQNALTMAKKYAGPELAREKTSPSNSAWMVEATERDEACIEKAEEALRAALAAQQAEPVLYTMAPHFRGYACLGAGAYLLNHSASGSPAELIISVATEEEKAGRTVGDERANLEGTELQPDAMAVRLRFENVGGLNALEKQLTHLRAEHFPETYIAPQPAQPVAVPHEMSPDFTDTARSALLWVLWHHQGGSSKVGQPIRFALGMGQHEYLNDHQVAEAKRWGELNAALAGAAQAEPLTDSYVQVVPDKCDRIVWRNHYYHLPIAAPTPPAATVPALETHDAMCPALDGGRCNCSESPVSIDKAWARFCGKIGRGKDAPYPGMIEAFEAHYGQSFCDKDWRTETAVWAAAWKAAMLTIARPTLTITYTVPMPVTEPLEYGKGYWIASHWAEAEADDWEGCNSEMNWLKTGRIYLTREDAQAAIDARAAAMRAALEAAK